MTYAQHGAVTSAAEVTNISPHGLWLLLDDHEVFLPYEQFPWFKEAPIGKVVHVEVTSPCHLYWPELDVDLEVESILYPERFPLQSRVHETAEKYSTGSEVLERDQKKINEAVLALLSLTLHDGNRAWKGYDYEVMDRLFEKGYIFNPRGKSKSVALTKEGLDRSQELFARLFGSTKENGGK